MSIIFEIQKDLSNLPSIVARFEGEFEKAKHHLAVEGKSLSQSNREQASWYCYYYSLLQQLKALEGFVDNNLEQKKGELWKKYKEKSDIALSTTDIAHYIDATPSYIELKTLLLVVKEMHGNMQGLVKAFEQRGFVLRNLTEMVVHELEKGL